MSDTENENSTEDQRKDGDYAIGYCKPPPLLPEHQFKPGQSGNPKGRPACGASVKEWWNVMQFWTREDIQKALDSPKTPANKGVAGRSLLKAWDESGSELERILCHTDGKPTESLTLSGAVDNPSAGPVVTVEAVERVLSIIRNAPDDPPDSPPV